MKISYNNEVDALNLTLRKDAVAKTVEVAVDTLNE